MVDLKKYEDEYNAQQLAAFDASIDMALVRQGIDPARVSKRDYDQIRRLNVKLSGISAKAQNQIAKVQEDASLEYNGVILELNKICLDLKNGQGTVQDTEDVVPAPKALIQVEVPVGVVATDEVV